jgi:hypothetical protein
MHCLLKDFLVNVHLVQAFLFDNMLTLRDATEIDSNTIHQYYSISFLWRVTKAVALLYLSA